MNGRRERGVLEESGDRMQSEEAVVPADLTAAIPILTYHSIDSSGSVISTDVAQFHRHMECLAEKKMRVISLREAVSILKHRSAFPRNAVALTFDDGFRNFFSCALPILKKFQFPATVFLVTGRSGKDNQWLGQSPHIPRLELLDWQEVREASREGIDFGVHTVTHPNLARLSHEELAREIIEPQRVISEHVGSMPQVFAYPYGIHTPAVEEIVCRTYEAACSVEMGFVSRDSHLYRLPRIDMYYFSRNDLFKWCGTSVFRRYVGLRRFLRRLRVY